jgi:Asp-tRNA(Asn)/Glu-tRNA(Gln) amidotransferase B subunit
VRHLINFLFKQSAKNQRKKGQSNYAQRQLEDFQSRVQEKQPPAWSSSTRQIENEVNNQLKVFQSYVRDIKEASLRLEELSKMLKSGEISENIYKLLLNELSSNLSLSV